MMADNRSENGKEMLRSLIESPFFDNWKNVFPEIILALLNEKIPVGLHNYCMHDTKSIETLRLEDMKDCGGIAFDQLKYLSEEESPQKDWLVIPDFKDEDIDIEPLSLTEYMLRPLCFYFDKNIPDTKRLVFNYILMSKEYVREYDNPIFAILLSVRMNGEKVKIDYLFDDKEQKKSYRFEFPKKIISQINRCLINHFWKKFWAGEPCAAQYQSYKGVVNYLGITKDTEFVKTFDYKDIIKLLSGPDGGAALILLSYTCFSVLKRFFPSYPIIKSSSKYTYVKRNVDKQIAINIRCCRNSNAEKLKDICCGFFSDFSSNSRKIPIIDGMEIQKPTKMENLSVAEFESKSVMPSCPLWTNRIPARELLQSGKILDICLESQNEISFNGLDKHPSSWVVQVLTNFIHDITVNPSEDSEMGRGIEYLNEDFEFGKRPGIKKYSLDFKFKERQALLHQYSKKLSDKYIVVGGLETASQHINEIDFDPEIIKKTAYLSASFWVLAYKVMPSEPDCMWICRKLEDAILNAFEVQMGNTDQSSIQDMIEDIILSMLNSGQYARLRGKGSEGAQVKIWYDPKESVFLFPSKTLYEELKAHCPTFNIRKNDLENFLVEKNILVTVQRKNQIRRTFEVVVRKGEHEKLSVFKIRLASLSSHFSKAACEPLEEMRKDKTPYRS